MTRVGGVDGPGLTFPGVGGVAESGALHGLQLQGGRDFGSWAKSSCTAIHSQREFVLAG